MSDFIPYGRHSLDEDDIQTVLTVLKGDWLTCGPMVSEFENKLCEVTKASYAIACSNGTTALHLALLALGIKTGDLVVVPAITFLATANAVRYVNADVVFADVDPETGLMSAETLQSAILACPDKANIKAVINVHLAGQCENLEKIASVAKQFNLQIIEDAAHAIGTTYINDNNQQFPIGSCKYSDLTTFSFHPVKTIAVGEGGAVTTNNQELAERIKTLRSHGMVRDGQQWLNRSQGYDKNGVSNPWYYEMQEIGYNFRISDINCALGISQLNKLEKFKVERQRLVKFYDDRFPDDKRFKSIKKLPNSQTAWHLYILQINFNDLHITRSNLMRHLAENKIGSQVHYIPVYRQPYYEKQYSEQRLPGAESYYGSCLSIPLFVGLKENEQEFIVQKIISIQ